MYLKNRFTGWFRWMTVTLTSAQVVSLAVSLAIVMIFTPRAFAQQDLIERVPPTSFVGIRLQPKVILQRPGMELIPTELIKVFGEKELGMDLLELETILLVMDPPEDAQMREPPKFAIFAKFATPQEIGGNALAQLQETQFDGMDGFTLGREVGIIKIDAQTFLMAPQDQIAKIAKSTANSSPLIKLFENGSEAPIAAHFVVEPVRELIKENLPSSVPPPFDQLLELPDLVDTISYLGSMQDGNLERLQIDAVNDESAERVVTVLNNLLKFGKRVAMGWVEEEVDISDPDYKRAFMQYAERLSQKLETVVQPTVDGKSLVYNIPSGGYSGGFGSIGTTSMLVGLLLPAVQQAREAARRAQSMNNIKQFGLSLFNYESVNRHFPPQYSVSKDGKPLLSWRVHILPYLEQDALYREFHLDEPWDSEHNIQLVEKMPLIFRSPNVNTEEGTTVYLGVSGKGMFFDGKTEMTFSKITDGSSNTAMLVEADADQATIWTRPGDWEFDEEDPLQGLGSVRPGGFLVGMADGSVRFMSIDEAFEVWAAMCTRDGGEVIPAGW